MLNLRLKKTISLLMAFAMLVCTCPGSMASDRLSEAEEPWENCGFHDIYLDKYVYLHSDIAYKDAPSFVQKFSNDNFQDGGLYIFDLTSESFSLLAVSVTAFQLVNDKVVYASGGKVFAISATGGQTLMLYNFNTQKDIRLLQANTKYCFAVIENTIYRVKFSTMSISALVAPQDAKLEFISPITNSIVQWGSYYFGYDESKCDDGIYFGDFSSNTPVIENTEGILKLIDSLEVNAPQRAVSFTSSQLSLLNSGIVPYPTGVKVAGSSNTYAEGTYCNYRPKVGNSSYVEGDAGGQPCTCHANNSIDCVHGTAGCTCMHVYTTGPNGREKVAQCFAFAMHSYYQLFNVTDVPATELKTNQKNFSNDATGAQMAKDYIQSLCTGTHLRLIKRSDGGRHSVIVSAYNDTSVAIYEGNYSKACIVEFRVRTYEEFVNQYTAVAFAASHGHSTSYKSDGARGHYLSCSRDGCSFRGENELHYIIGTPRYGKCAVCNYVGNISIGTTSIGDDKVTE